MNIWPDTAQVTVLEAEVRYDRKFGFVLAVMVMVLKQVVMSTAPARLMEGVHGLCAFMMYFPEAEGKLFGLGPREQTSVMYLPACRGRPLPCLCFVSNSEYADGDGTGT